MPISQLKKSLCEGGDASKDDGATLTKGISISVDTSMLLSVSPFLVSHSLDAHHVNREIVKSNSGHAIEDALPLPIHCPTPQVLASPNSLLASSITLSSTIMLVSMLDKPKGFERAEDPFPISF
jgi:hypothetical protein